MSLYSGLKEQKSTRRNDLTNIQVMSYIKDVAVNQLKPVTGILILLSVLCSCGHGRSHERQANNSHQGTATENVQITCSWDEDSLDGQKVFRVVDEMPIYAGGMGKYFELIKKDIKLPDDDKMWQSITVIIIVDTLGGVRNECVLNKHSDDRLTSVEAEVLQAVKKHQDWTPAKHQGRKVPVKLILLLKIGHRSE